MPQPTETRANLKSRREAEESRKIVQIAKGLSATMGSDFFQSVVKHLANAFHADYVYIGELAGTPVDRIRTLAVFGDHKLSQPIEQKLEGTTSGQVIKDGWFGCKSGVRRWFPLDILMEALEAEAYMGLSLSDVVGQRTGILALASKVSFGNLVLVKSVMETFVPRAAVELERKRQEDSHREAEERHRAFIAHNPDAMWRIELEQPVPLNLPEEEQIRLVYQYGYLAECNDALAHLAGMEHGKDLIGWRFGQVAERTNGAASEELGKAVRSGFRFSTVETTPRDATGQPSYRIRTQFGIVDSGTLRRIWGTTRDITDLRRTEHILAASERRFREVLQGIHLPAVMLDQNGILTFSNDYFLRLAQRTPEEASALSWLGDLVPESEGEIWKQKVAGKGAARPATVHFEGTLIPKNSPRRLIEWDTIRLFDENNQPAGMAAVGRDITQQRALEFEIRQTQKLESIGRLAAGVAHDFNNLVTVILGHARLLLEEANWSSPTRKRIMVIEAAAVQCSQLSSQLMAFGRRQFLQPELVNLNDVIREDEDVLRNLVGPGVELILDPAEALGFVYADAIQIQRALTNLVTNARDAMPDGGKIVVSTSNVTVVDDDSLYPGIEPGAYVAVSVSDTGTGLSDEVRRHIFEPFFTTKEPGKGTGLGLPTVYGIVTQSGGHIVVHSVPGQGARFEILLPERDQEPAGDSTEVPPSQGVQ